MPSRKLVEGLGGTFNASTDRELTVYYVRVPARHAATAMEVLGELVVRPNLDEAEIENERDVIVEEIRSYLDDPAEHVNVLFDLAMFDDTPLGREIAGSEESVRALPATAIHEFWRRTTGRPMSSSRRRATWVMTGSSSSPRPPSEPETVPVRGTFPRPGSPPACAACGRPGRPPRPSSWWAFRRSRVITRTNGRSRC